MIYLYATIDFMLIWGVCGFVWFVYSKRFTFRLIEDKFDRKENEYNVTFNAYLTDVVLAGFIIWLIWYGIKYMDIK